MRRVSIPLICGIAALLLALAPRAHAAEVALDQVPKVVMDAVTTRFADATVRAAATEKTPEGNEVYEINLEGKDLNNIDMTLTPEGAMVLIEQQIERERLPAALAKTLEAKFPKARYRLIEEVITMKDKEEKLSHYEVLLITRQKQIRSVEVGLDGKILKVEKKTSEEED